MKWYAQLMGYSFPILLGILLMRNMIERLWDCLVDHNAKLGFRPPAWQPEFLARLESVLFILFLQLGQAWFIAAWMAMKIAGQWMRWMDPGDAQVGRPPGHVVFNMFMIGNGLLILFAVVGYKLIGWVNREDWLLAFWAPTLITLLTVLCYVKLGPYRKSLSAPAKPTAGKA
ncbi:MAG: hypothetical protein WCO56_28855 [Verrucomicrobiota bacterium]